MKGGYHGAGGKRSRVRGENATVFETLCARGGGSSGSRRAACRRACAVAVRTRPQRGIKRAVAAAALPPPTSGAGSRATKAMFARTSRRTPRCVSARAGGRQRGQERWWGLNGTPGRKRRHARPARHPLSARFIVRTRHRRGSKSPSRRCSVEVTRGLMMRRAQPHATLSPKHDMYVRAPAQACRHNVAARRGNAIMLRHTTRGVLQGR